MPTRIGQPATERRSNNFKMELTDFTGGLNTTQGDEDIELNELSDAENYVPERPGSKILRKREGLTSVSNGMGSLDCQLIFQGALNNYYTTVTTIEDLDNGNDLDTGLTSSTTWDAATFEGADIFVNGTEERVTTDGTNFGDLAGSPPNAKYIESHNNFLFAAGHSNNALRWSALGDKDSWSVTNEILFTDANDNITGLAKFRDVLMVFTENRFYHVNGFSTTDISVTHSGHEGPGCVSNKSIVVNPAGIFWWTTQGLAFSNDGIRVDLPMQRKLQATLENINGAQLALIHGVWSPEHDRVQFYVPTGSSTRNDTCIYYYYMTDTFYIGTGNGAAMNASFQGVSSGAPVVYLGGYNTGNTNEIFTNTGNTDGLSGGAVSITAFLETARFAPLGDTAFHKGDSITLKTGPVPTNGNITLITYADDATSATDTLTLAAVTTDSENEAVFRRRFNKLKIRIGDALATRPRIRGAIVKGYFLND